jgi:hypothetical protein
MQFYSLEKLCHVTIVFLSRMGEEEGNKDDTGDGHIFSKLKTLSF